jgi:hypothetical protein
MIVVKIELWPGGFEAGKKEIGRAEIANTGELGNGPIGNYDIKLLKSEKYSTKPGSIWKKGRLNGFVRERGPYDLVAACITSVLGPERIAKWGKLG